MTDEEKELIKREILKSYVILKMVRNPSTRYTIAIKMGLDNAQRILNEKEWLIEKEIYYTIICIGNIINTN